jgi:hypothetical protein
MQVSKPTIKHVLYWVGVKGLRSLKHEQQKCSTGQKALQTLVIRKCDLMIAKSQMRFNVWKTANAIFWHIYWLTTDHWVRRPSVPKTKISGVVPRGERRAPRVCLRTRRLLPTAEVTPPTTDLRHPGALQIRKSDLMCTKPQKRFCLSESCAWNTHAGLHWLLKKLDKSESFDTRSG